MSASCYLDSDADEVSGGELAIADEVIGVFPFVDRVLGHCAGDVVEVGLRHWPWRGDAVGLLLT